MIDVFTLDTNLLFYAVQRDDARHEVAAKLVLGAALAGNCRIGSQALGEFFRAVTMKKVMPASEAERQVEDWMRNFTVFTPDEADLKVAMKAVQVHSLSFWDAHLIAAARRAGCRAMLTEDLQDGFMFGELQIVDPFVEKNRDVVRPIVQMAQDRP